MSRSKTPNKVRRMKNARYIEVYLPESDFIQVTHIRKDGYVANITVKAGQTIKVLTNAWGQLLREDKK